MSGQARIGGWHWMGLDDDCLIRQALPVGFANTSKLHFEAYHT